MSTEKKQKMYVLQHSALESYRERSLSKSHMLIELLRDYLEKEFNDYNKEAIELICEYIATIKKMSEFANSIVSEAEPYKDVDKKIDGYKITHGEYVLMDGLMIVGSVVEAHLYNTYNISLIPS